MTIDAWQAAKNILCIRLDYLGDVLMCTPAMRAIKESVADRRITLLTSGSGGVAASFIPEVDTVIEYAAPWMKSSNPHDAGIDMDFVGRLKACAFDAAVIFTTYSQSALPAAMLCYLAGIPLRLAHCRENPYQMLTDWIPETEPEKQLRHETRRQLDLVASIGCRTSNERLSFSVPPSNISQMRQRLAQHGIDLHKPWIAMHPGATAASRRYPVSHWAMVTRELAVRYGYPIVFTGAAAEADLIDEIKRNAGVASISLAGELGLGELGATIALASVLVSNNTGPAHIAAAVGTPTVVLYALTNPQHTPWQVRRQVLYHDVSCRFCYKSSCPQGHHDCLNKVEPSQVIRAVQVLLQPESAEISEPDTVELYRTAARHIDIKLSSPV